MDELTMFKTYIPSGLKDVLKMHSVATKLSMQEITTVALANYLREHYMERTEGVQKIAESSEGSGELFT